MKHEEYQASWPKRTKVECLPIVRTGFGFEQRAAWSNPDLYHEEVVEMSSPFDLLMNDHPSSSAHGRLLVQSVLLVGDQNAGKSTFLHSFVASSDPSFTRLNGQLPLLEAAFLNSRFLPEAAPLDQLPFLDTDIARTTLLVGMDDWNFLLQENGLPPETTRCATMCLQLIEIGGDHLDRMMNLSAVQDVKLQQMCRNSLQLLAKIDKAVYVLNGQTLNNLGQTRERLDFLLRQNTLLELLIFLSRETHSSQAAQISQELGRAVTPFSILDASGNLSVEGIVAALCAMVKSRQLLPLHSQEALVAEHLICFWKAWACRGSIAQGDEMHLWIQPRDFYAYMSQDEHNHAHEGYNNVIPLGDILHDFEDAANALCRNGFAIKRFSALTSNFGLAVSWGGRSMLWSPKHERGDDFAFRFPLFPPLFEFFFGDRENVPAEFWMAEGTRVRCNPVILRDLERYIWSILIEKRNVQLFLVLLDEWILATGGTTTSFPGPEEADGKFVYNLLSSSLPAQEPGKHVDDPRLVVRIALHP